MESKESKESIDGARSVVQRMRELLVERGWVQDALRGDNGELCLTAAFRLAITNGRYVQSIPEKFRDGTYEVAFKSLIRATKRRDAYNLVSFNDDVARSAGDVFELIDSVIEELREEAAS